MEVVVGAERHERAQCRFRPLEVVPALLLPRKLAFAACPLAIEARELRSDLLERGFELLLAELRRAGQSTCLGQENVATTKRSSSPFCRLARPRAVLS